jgi:hypothetical protein
VAVVASKNRWLGLAFRYTRAAKPSVMRKEVKAALINALDLLASTELQGFKRIPRRKGEDPGLVKYGRKIKKGSLWLLIGFRPISSEAFDAWIGWAPDDYWPQNISQDEIYGIPVIENPVAKVCSMNLVPRDGSAHWSFWKPTSEALDNPDLFASEFTKHFCKALTEQDAQKLVMESVCDAMKEVVDFGLPLLLNKEQLVLSNEST